MILRLAISWFQAASLDQIASLKVITSWLGRFKRFNANIEYDSLWQSNIGPFEIPDKWGVLIGKKAISR